uniref:(northern house mosquito) hypothetical protein n=1 Tax=Culex pipiens TaxID=7175 RepID=A0A8D8DY72_CULPI
MWQRGKCPPGRVYPVRLLGAGVYACGFPWNRRILWIFREAKKGCGSRIERVSARFWHDCFPGNAEPDDELHHRHRTSGKSLGDVLQRNPVRADCYFCPARNPRCGEDVLPNLLQAESDQLLRVFGDAVR